MPSILKTLVVIGLFTVAMAHSAQADFLKNTDFKSGIVGWHGDGKIVFLKEDGTEGSEGDTGVSPAIKVTLSRGQLRSVYQEFETRDHPTALHARVEVFASSDFARSKNPNDYSVEWKPNGVWYWSSLATPDVDFWLRIGGSSFCYKVVNLVPANWTTVDVGFEGLPKDQDRTINFCLPNGTGFVYLKNPSVTP